MSSKAKRTPAATPDPALLTPEQAMAELEATIKRLGFVPSIVAKSNFTGKTCDIADFMPHTHTAMIQFTKG